MTVDVHPEKLHFQAEVKQLLDIVIHSLYSNKEIFLRELVSNASDAVDKLRFEALSNTALYEGQSDFIIRIRFDVENNTLSIEDNGIGMNREEVITNLGTIAKSGTRDFLSQLTGDQKKDSHLIGQFGVGFYSAFIVADRVVVRTRRAGLAADLGVTWESAGDGEYTVSNIEKIDRGTEIILHLKEDQKEFLTDWRIRSIITKYSDHITIPIQMLKRTEDDKVSDEWETVNRATALWSLPKSSITDEQYQEFYKHIAHDFNAPLAWTHHKIEGGNIDYTTLLYVPKEPTHDLWQRQTHHGLKLYVQRVFIMDEVEQFLPMYLRFMRGVLDTTALPLNISREILQDHHTIPKLKSALIRHSLDLLQRLAEDEVNKYAEFWKVFGNVLKEGVAEDFANRERVAKLLRFSSTQAGGDEQIVSFDEYIKRAHDKQNKIYYLTADHLNAAKSSPHLEIFLKNNIEVLLLTDKIDEWVVAHLSEYEGKTLQSIVKGDLQLDDLLLSNEEEKKAEQEKDDAFKLQYETLLKAMNKTLEGKVKEVKISHRLTASPACLIRDENALGPQMERLMKAAGQPIMEVKPTLEVNPNHAMIRHLNELHDDALLTEWVVLLYEQALLAEGGQLIDPAAFVHRMNNLWINK